MVCSNSLASWPQGARPGDRPLGSGRRMPLHRVPAYLDGPLCGGATIIPEGRFDRLVPHPRLQVSSPVDRIPAADGTKPPGRFHFRNLLVYGRKNY
jgi:hypothetical protein